MQLWKVIGFTNVIFAFKESIVNIPGCLEPEKKGAIHEMTEYKYDTGIFHQRCNRVQFLFCSEGSV